MRDSAISPQPGFYEFFAGGGMVRAGLGPEWRCLFANDIDPAKGRSYRVNWGGDELRLADIATLTAADLPGRPDLVWGSFPCQDLSLAGRGEGLGGRRSGTFFPFWRLIDELAVDGRAPRIVAVENVCGTLTSRGGRDFEAILHTFLDAGYRPGALIINADLFVPQSRPRLFVVGVRGHPPGRLSLAHPDIGFHPEALTRAIGRMPVDLREAVVWWRLPQPERPPAALEEMLDPDDAHAWRSDAETARLLAMMSPVNLSKVRAAREGGDRVAGALFRRTRKDSGGASIQRAEVRFDRAGCLRTPAGGSSRQDLLLVQDGQVRSRLFSAREAARLMGLDDGYILPSSHADAYRLAGDGVAAPIVAHLNAHLFQPLVGLQP